MFYILCGSFWVVLTSIVEYDGLEMKDLLFIHGCKIMGIILMLVGLKIVIRDTMTKIKGEECFGKVIKVYATNKHINNRTVYKADFAVYISSLEKVEILSEEIGLDRTKFPKGDFFKVKTYKGDLNLGKKIDKNQIPIFILDIVNAVSEQNDIANSSTFFEDKYKISEKIEVYGEGQKVKIIKSMVSEYGISLKEANEALDDYLKNIHKSN